MWAQGLGTAPPITASFLCSRTWSLLLAGPWLLQIASLLNRNKMDFSMKYVHVEAKLTWFSLIWLVACNNGLDCLTFYFAVVRGEEKFSASIRNIHDMGGKKTTKKSILSISGLETTEGLGKGFGSSKSSFHHTPNPPACCPPAHSTHPVLAA